MSSTILGIIASSGAAAADTNSYISISTVTVGSGGSATITFSSIPATYTHLQIRGIVRNSASGAGGAEAILQFNGTSTNYVSFHQVYGDGTSAVAGNNLGTSNILPSFNPKSGTTANTFAGVVIDILDYTNTNKNKTVRTLSGWDANGDGFIIFRSGLWINTSAISSITIGMESTFNLAQYSSFALYGIKGS
jgi:hypothetical protein